MQVEEDLQRLERAAGLRDDAEEAPFYETGRDVSDARSESGISAYSGRTASSRMDASVIAERYRNRAKRAGKQMNET